MKLRHRIFWLLIIVLASFPLTWSCYPKYMGHTLILTEDSRHVIGYFVLGFFFGWLSLIFAVVDELLQVIAVALRFKEGGFAWNQVYLNLMGTILGLTLRSFIKLSIKFNHPVREISKYLQRARNFFKRKATGEKNR